MKVKQAGPIRVFTFTPDDAVTGPAEFTDALFAYAAQNDLDLVITKEGMYPEFTIDGVAYTAERIYHRVGVYGISVPVATIRCTLAHPELYKPAAAPSEQRTRPRNASGGPEMKKYTVGQIAKAMGVSPQTLRHYEELGLISGSRNLSNRYREYDATETRRLFLTALYRSMGFSLKESKALLDSYDARQAEDAFTQRIAAVDAELHRLAVLRSELLEYREHIAAATAEPPELRIVPEGKELYAILKPGSGRGVLENDTDTENRDVLEFQKKAPHVRQGFWIGQANLLQAESVLEFRYGPILRTEYVRDSGYTQRLSPYLVSLRGPVVYFILKETRPWFSHESFQPVLAALAAQGWQLASDLYGVSRYTSYRSGETLYFEFVASVVPFAKIS